MYSFYKPLIINYYKVARFLILSTKMCNYSSVLKLACSSILTSVCVFVSVPNGESSELDLPLR